MSISSAKLSTQPYRGTRDFYPADWAVQQYIFEIWRRVCLSFGFEEYMTPLLEPFDLYAAKSGEEIVDEQLYSLIDRGGRKVAIRPEMTPSVARLIAAREKELSKPIKWFSIANFYRYERPQKGRVREFWQLNADIFGIEGVTADFEILQLNRAIMNAFGATPEMYEVRVNNRKLMDYLYREELNLSDLSVITQLSRLIDKKEKLTEVEFLEGVAELGLSPKQQEKVDEILSYTLDSLTFLQSRSEGAREVVELFNLIGAADIAEGIVFSPGTVRGLDYYDGIVFEQFDLNLKSSRSMFGGGRYNGLLQIFGRKEYPATGFAAGDVTTCSFLDDWGLLPDTLSQTRVQALVTVFPGGNGQNFDVYFRESVKVVQILREQNIRAELILQKQSLGSQLDYASRRDVPFVIIRGPEEIKTGVIIAKNMRTGEQQRVEIDKVGMFLQGN